MQQPHRVSSQTPLKLKDIPTRNETSMKKEEAVARLADLKAELDILQEEMYAAGQNSALIVLQGMDTSGKDGAIRSVFGDVSPAGCRVESFKVPTEEEIGHDFLWRVHKVTPRKGMIAVFNRSHYEDVLVVRVHNLVPKSLWEQRYAMINAFEQLLAAHNTIIIKFFLHISKDEQEERLLARERDIEKAWKIATRDWEERKLWNEYQAAYQDALSQCSPEHAPWYIVPSDQKWYRNVLIAETVVNTLKQYRETWGKTLKAMNKARLQELEAYRSRSRSE